MEVTPELYAWLTDLNIINPFSSLKTSSEGNFILPEKTIELMIGGKYMDIILTTLQEAYNKFYKLHLDYLTRLNELKEISEEQKYISNSVKYANWHLINEILNKFGISYTEEQINQLINGDKELVDIVKLVSDMESSSLSYQIIMVISVVAKKMVEMFLFSLYSGFEELATLNCGKIFRLINKHKIPIYAYLSV